jgi:hypothetical protein
MPRSDDTTALEGGYWERTGLIMVWKTTPPPVFDLEPTPVEPPRGWEEITLTLQARHSTDNALRVAHAAYNRGNRDPLTVARNREWQRRYQQSRRDRARG